MISCVNLLRCGLALLSAFTFVQCTSTAVSLDYQPNLTQIVPGPPVVAAGRFANMRGEPETMLGAVRTPIGTPVEHITTNIPVEEVVRNSFAYGLRSRHMLVPQNSAGFILSGEVMNLNVTQVVRPAATCRIRVNLLRTATGQVVFSKIYKAEREDPPYLPGSASAALILRELGSRVLQDVVDHALDDAGLRASLYNGPRG